MKYRLSISNGQLVKTSTQPAEMGIEEFDEPKIQFAMKFEKEMNLSENVNKNEVDLYLIEALEKKNNTFDLLMWWKVNCSKYLILRHIAQDLLAMPVSTVALESAFSIGSRVLNCYKSSISSKTLKALICTQNWC